MRSWVVGGGVLERGQELLLVRNRRRNGSVDWTTPGGVIDEGESVLEGLSREVSEETGLSIGSWTRHLYTVTVKAPDLGWFLRAEVYLADQVSGDLVIADPDGIVEEARWVDAKECVALTSTSQRWLSEPLFEWMEHRWGGAVRSFDYHLAGTEPGSYDVTRL